MSAEIIEIEFLEIAAIEIEIEGTATWDSLAGKPANYPSDSFQTPAFANPLVCDAAMHKDFKCGIITDDTIINLINTSDGDAGMIELIIDGTGGYTVALGTMFTKCIGGEIDMNANVDNFVSWRKIEIDIVYIISQIDGGDGDGSGIWGFITGDITEQEDLIEELNDRVDKEIGKSLVADIEIAKIHASGSDAETASSIINLGIDEIELSLINSFK